MMSPPPAVRIIARDGSAGVHHLRDVLARNSIPYVIHSADSEEGRKREWSSPDRKAAVVRPGVSLQS